MAYMDIEKVEERELVPGFFVRLVHTGNMTVAYWRAVEGAELPLHSHHHEQVTNVVEGSLEFNVDGDVRIVSAPGVIVIPPNVPHGGKALTAIRLIDVFHPAREDYK